jgi:D-alanine-D-alanine ligase
MELAGLKVGLTYDRRSDYLALGFSEEQVAEFDSDATIDALEEAIRANGARPDRIGHARRLCQRLVAGDRWDLVFNIAEGVAGRGRESEVPCLLEVYGIPCTFSDPLVCAVTLDKAMAKRVVQSYGLNTPRFHVVRTPGDLAAVRLPYPLFAKPIGEGTGKGIDRRSLARTAQELDAVCRSLLERLRQPVLVEEFLPGREFTVGVLGTGPEARVLGTMEVVILPHANTTIYSYEVKEKCEELVRYERPRRDALIAAVEQLALDTYRALELRDGGRADIRLDREGRPSFMEVNPLPGLHPQHSDLPMIATQEGMPYPALIGAILRSALRRLD